MNALPGGIHTVMVTPFKDNEDLDYNAFEKQLARAVDAGTDGLVVAGSTGEFYSLTDQERITLVRIARSVLPSGKPVVAGANALNVSTRATGDIAAKLGEAGADALLLLSPIFVKPSHREVIDFFASVNKISGLPIVAYNNPGRTGVTFDAALLAELVATCGVIGLKDSSKDLEFVARASNAHSGTLTVYTGMDTLIGPTLAAGGTGVMSMAHQVLPDLVTSTFDAATRDDWAETRVGTAKLAEFYGLLYGWKGAPYAVLKAAMNCRGWEGGVPRRPLAAVSGDYTRKVEAFMDSVLTATEA